MVTDARVRSANDSDRDMAYVRTPHEPYQGDGCGAELTPEQIPVNVARVTRWFARGFSLSASLAIVGLRGPAAAQVIASMEAE